ncbi:MAG: hypothetical protein Q7U54_10485 [Bacteroidales bacterium]|nr:hypothetical protein [Bacteroidales bacterium]
MGLIKEPIEVDFFVDPRPLTADEQLKISEFIKTDKQKRKMIKKVTKTKHLI